jgi:hypothetical protein
MDSLKRLRNEELKSKLEREFSKQLHEIYDPVAKDALPPRLQELLQRLDAMPHQRLAQEVGSSTSAGASCSSSFDRGDRRSAI